ncbi:MAG: TIGR04283 family arsenosugar biosynthesis glycosyltransferase [Gammaproteobacteria bacterium]|nr:TIGR04283 family arsenosugar biosynthesis glycosyltransferase [Gammaproteobacteria bacterium]
MQISIIIPVLNEAPSIAVCLGRLQPYRAQGHEIIVVDGGSHDDTAEIARPLADEVLASPAGRAVQMNHGARAAQGDVLLFLHADTQLPDAACDVICAALQTAARWGRFDVRLSGSAPSFRLIEFMMNLRSRMTRIATGDQAMFVTKDLFHTAGGFDDIPLMEDIALSRCLKKKAHAACLHERVVTSSRRWEENGIFRTILLMWRLRFSYWLGADPVRLVRQYYR